MHIVQLLLPLARNDAQPQAPSLFGKVREELVQKYGGLTAFTRSPAVGLWKDYGEVERDKIVIFEVMAGRLDRKWWAAYRKDLEARFEQEAIVIRAYEIETL